MAKNKELKNDRSSIGKESRLTGNDGKKWFCCDIKMDLLLYQVPTASTVFQKPDTGQARIATSKDREMICNYLKQSQIFQAEQKIMNICGDGIILI